MKKKDGTKKNDLEKELKSLQKKAQVAFMKKWKRALPLDEMFFDRWDKAKFLKFGDKTSVYQHAFVYGDVKVGKNTWIGPFVILDGTGGLEIGDYCSISTGAQIYSHDTVKWAVSGGKHKYEYGKTKIGDCCCICPNVVIKKGVTIGDHSVAATGSFVNKDVPPRSIVAGAPAKIIGRVIVKDNGEVRFVYLGGRRRKK